MQGDAAVGQAARRTVLQVAPNGAAYVCKLGAYLMVPPCVEGDFKEVVPFTLPDKAVVQDGPLAARHLVVVSPGLIGALVAGKPMRQGSLVAGRSLRRYGPVGLPHLFVAGKHRAQAAQRLACAGKDDNPADGTVQPVHHTQEDLAGLVVLLLQVSLYGFGQGGVARLVALGDFACRLGDDDAMVVLVEWQHPTCSFRHRPG